MLVFSSALVLLEVSEEVEGKVVVEDGVMYTVHAPIRINSNANFTVANGVTGGSGTSGDPSKPPPAGSSGSK